MNIKNIQRVNHLILCIKNTELMTITPPIRNKIVGISPKIKKVIIIPNIGNKE